MLPKAWYSRSYGSVVGTKDMNTFDEAWVILGVGDSSSRRLAGKRRPEMMKFRRNPELGSFLHGFEGTIVSIDIAS